MPSEVRHILFRTAETLLAVRMFHRRTQIKLPSGSIVRFSIDEKPQIRSVMTIATDDGGKEFVNVLDSVNLAAALILYCKDNKIPLPADAGKTLRMVGSSLALVIKRIPKNEECPDIDKI